MKGMQCLGILLVLLAAGVVHGMRTHRWLGESGSDMGRDVLHEVNDPLGEWTPAEFYPPDETNTVKGTRSACRKYVSTARNRTIVASLTSGHPGIVAVHTPDICYVGTGYKLKSTIRQQSIKLNENGDTASFYVADFQKPSSLGNDTIRVRWGWSAAGSWEAPESPRWKYAREHVLYKLYIVHPVTEEEDLSKDDPYKKFVADLAQAVSSSLSR